MCIKNDRHLAKRNAEHHF